MVSPRGSLSEGVDVCSHTKKKLAKREAREIRYSEDQKES